VFSQFPSLCNQYYKLITFMCEIFPEKIPQLPEDLFKSLMVSLELGLTSYPPTASMWGPVMVLSQSRVVLAPLDV